MSNIKKNLSRVREKIERSIEQAEEDHLRRLMQRRMELARAGIEASKAKQFDQAVKAFHSYLRMLEEMKGVPEGGLIPANFDRTKELAEMLMISGVYWDLLKIYDRTKAPEKKRVFLHYMEKYILFSKGMPFQALCAEILRKYLNNEKPVHRSEFKNAYRMLGDSKCFVATSLVDVSHFSTMTRLRLFRDQVLRNHPKGRLFISWYYRNGPSVAKWIDHLPHFVRFILAKCLDCIAVLCGALTNQSTNSFGSKDKLAIRKANPK